MRRRRRRFEQLEDRRMLAAYINEILYDPFLGNTSTEQYVELRGPESSILDDGTYLVIVESEGDAFGPEGTIHGIFDLSGQSFGSNGFLVLLQQNSPFEALSDNAANVLVSTEPEFGNLPDDLFQSSHPSSDRLDATFASNSFFLIQSSTPPQLGDDIDLNSDGIIDPDGVYADWQVFDSVSTMWGFNDGHGYGDIVFVDRSESNPTVTLQENGIEVGVSGSGYIARIGNSTGSHPEDWVAGTVKDLFDDDLFYRLAADTHGVPSPSHLHGRELDSIGSENFTGAVRADFYEDTNNDQKFDDGIDLKLPGVIALVDSNGNDQRDSIETIVEPDLFPLETALNNRTPGVSLTTALTDNSIPGFDITSVQESGAAEGQFVFAHADFGFFSQDSRLRMDFYRAADSVSIDVIGNSNSAPTYGRLEVFDAAGNSLEFVRTSALDDGQRETLTISRPTDDIAWAIAYSDDEYLDSSQFGKFDTLRFSVPEVIAESDAQGFMTLNYVDPGSYTLIPLPGSGSPYLFEPVSLEIDRYENFQLTIPASDNLPPVFEPANLSTEENIASGTVIGTVVANDDPQQAVSYSLLQGAELFSIDASSGVVRLRDGAELNYEIAAQHTITVQAIDNGETPLSSQATFTIAIEDVNDPPVVVGQLDPVTGLAGYPLAATFDRSVVQDEDADQSLTWRLEGAGTTLPDWIEFDSSTLSVSGTPWNPDAGELSLRLVAGDDGQPVLSVFVDVLLTIEYNDAPWLNRDNPLDADASGDIRPLDALVIINYLNRDFDPAIPWDVTYRPNFLDVNGNNFIEPIDALRIINELNRQGNGEGESIIASAAPLRTSDALSGPYFGSIWDAGVLGWLQDDDEERHPLVR